MTIKELGEKLLEMEHNDVPISHFRFELSGHFYSSKVLEFICYDKNAECWTNIVELNND